MPRKKKLYGKGFFDSLKTKLSNANDYLKSKRIIHNLITNDINWSNPIRAVAQGYNINKFLQNSILGTPMKYLE